jgi:glycerophosphoryl diester phosphodiesterase
VTSILERIQSAARLLRRGWRPVLFFQLWLAALSAVAFGPALAWLLNRLVSASGSMAVSNYELVGFFLSVPGVIFLVVFSTISLGLIFLNNSGLVVISGALRHDDSVSPVRLLQHNLTKFRRLALLGLWALLFGVILAIPFVLTLWLIVQTQLGAADINYYLATEPPEWIRAKRLAGSTIGVFVLIGGWVALRWSVAIQHLLYSEASPLSCLGESWRLTRGRWGSLFLLLAMWWIGLTVVSGGIGFVYTAAGSTLLEWAGLSLGWVTIVVALIAAGYLIGGVAYGVVGAGINELLLTEFFFEHAGSSVQFRKPPEKLASETRLELTFRRVVWASAAIALVGSVSGIVGALSSVRTDHQPLVTAHRGSSASAPENSLSALKLAIEQRADYSEIDVQHTADGVIVLMHDADFMRIAGEPYKLDKVTLRQAREFDISGKFKDEYAGERVGTLQEAIDLARDKMKLNVELKYNRPNADLASSVVELIRKNDFEDQCVITSLELAPLLAIEEKWPDMETGLIVSAVVGDVTRIPVDFYSLNSAQATPSFINLAHKRGKGVHVWTINTSRQMNQMIEQGADNLITDVPDQVRDLLRYRSELSPAERMALRMRNALLYNY